MSLIRVKCCICNSKNITEIQQFQEFPIKFTMSLDTNFNYSTLCFVYVIIVTQYKLID